jgi:flavin reductase (DIM6/NTAB) family NADH-FMN oxidoreductase RutF
VAENKKDVGGWLSSGIMIFKEGPNMAYYTNPAIKENGTFSVNIPLATMADVTDYCGLVSGKKCDKAKMFETFYGKLKTAPMIKECPYNEELDNISELKRLLVP